MKIAFLNGSPRGKKSASEFLLKLVEKNLSEEFCPVFYNASKPWTEETRKELLQFDILLSASPVTVYTIVNCGFFYSNENAMRMLSCKLMSTVSATDQYVQILMPCKLFTFVAERVWCVKARKNGLKEKELGYFE